MKLLKAYKTIYDERGHFLGIINNGKWEEINYIETKAHDVRGGHYHKETIELFFIIDGIIDVTIKDLNDSIISKTTVKKGDVILIEPYEVHSFTCQTDARWINILSKRMNEESIDIYKTN